MQHIPVLRKEVLSFLRESDCNIADLTAGLGGHSKLFLQQQCCRILAAKTRTRK